MAQTAQEIKEKIIQTLRFKGPSLPVHLASASGQSILFTGAFLSELLGEKQIKQTHMRVGSSPVYFLAGQEPQLEKFQEHISGKEKEALMLLKENKFLDDIEQLTPIRVALRSIKDFAIPFQKNDKLIWRYFRVPETEYQIEQTTEIIETQEKASEALKQIIETEAKKREEQKENEINNKNTNDEDINTIQEKKQEDNQKNTLNIFDEEKTKKQAKKVIKKKTIKKQGTSAPEKKNEKFFDKVKKHLNLKKIEITGIEGFSKDDLTLKVLKNNQKYLLIAYNKKTIKDDEIIKAHKKAKENNLPYILLSLGEPTKKLQSFIDAIKALDSREKIE